MKKFTIYRHTAEIYGDWTPGDAIEKEYDFEKIEAEFDTLEEAQEEFQKSWYNPSGVLTGMGFCEVEEYSLWAEDEDGMTLIDSKECPSPIKYELRKNTMELPVRDVYDLSEGVTLDQQNQEPEIIKTFDDEYDALKALEEYSSFARYTDGFAHGFFEVEEYYVEENAYDYNGELIFGGDVSGFAKDNFDEIIEAYEGTEDEE